MNTYSTMDTGELCPVCTNLCQDGCVYCETCKHWIHFRCQSIFDTDEKLWGEESLDYICRSCRCLEDGQFDYFAGLQRLRNDAIKGNLESGVQREALFMKYSEMKTDLFAEFDNHTQDEVSNTYLREYYSTSKIALKSSGDGNCLFNSISILLVGNESRSLEMRYRCCLEMVTNKYKFLNHRKSRALKNLCPKFNDECENTTKVGAWASAWHVMALAYALKTPIQLVYPAVNGSSDFAFKNLNTTFKPPFVDPHRKTISIMFTSTAIPRKNAFLSKKKHTVWTPNHFVPLVATSVKAVYSETLPSSFEKDVHEPTKSTKQQLPTKSSTPVALKTNNSSAAEVGKGGHEVGPDADHTDLPYSPYKPDLSTIEEEHTSPCPSEDMNQKAEESTICISENEESGDNDDVADVSFTSGPLKKFMDLAETIAMLKGPYAVLDEIPRGRKDGMYFVINNASNIEKRANGNRSNFWDDCGTWLRGATPCSSYMQRDGKLVTIFKYQGQYCELKQAKKKREYIPLDPQPSSDSVIQVHRFYQNLKASAAGPDQFKKRVTWFSVTENSDSALPNDVAVVEYIGRFPGRSFHGSVKDTDKNVHYIRTKPSVLQDLKKDIKHRSVKDVEREMNINIVDDFEKQRNEKQLRNLKYQCSKNENTASNGNQADHVLCVEEMVKTTDYVQSVKHINGLPNPVVTLFTQQQIRDIQRFCCKEGGCVLGMDKTFNLGEFHVTPTVYKDLSVRKRNTGEHPICFGPTFVHTSSTTKAYSAFLHDIADELSENQLANLTIGTDEEAAFKSAIKKCLPGATQVLCTKHLKENTNRYLENTVGYPQKERTTLLSDIYGQNGLTEATDIDVFNVRYGRLVEQIKKKDADVGEKKFLPYFSNRLVPLLQEHVIGPVKEGKVDSFWTNNNCESANHVLKTATQWKLVDLPKFLGLWKKIVGGEQNERLRAIRNMGNFSMAKEFVHHVVDIDHWERMTTEQRDRRIEKFLRDEGRTSTNVVISKDGSRSILRTPTAGRKPNQKKRPRSERSRSRTPEAKRRL